VGDCKLAIYFWHSPNLISRQDDIEYSIGVYI
jgi:hypothetical protein